MAFLRNIRSRSLYPLHKFQIPNAPTHSIPSNSDQISRISVNSRRPFSLSTLFSTEINGNSKNINVSSEKSNKKPLDIFFKEAVGIHVTHRDTAGTKKENDELRSKLRKLEEEVRVLQEEKNNIREKEIEEAKKALKGDEVKGNVSKLRNLHSLFAKGSAKRIESVKSSEDDRTVVKELSPDMVVLVIHLYHEGYFKDANFIRRRNKFDITCFEDAYAWSYIKHAAEEFGKDNQGVAKWLSAGDVKKVARFGCPSYRKKHVYAAKKLRNFFKVQEDIVCGKCALRDKCKYAYTTILSSDSKTLHLYNVMTIITQYALKSVPPELVVPEEIEKSVSRLLKEVVKLSNVC